MQNTLLGPEKKRVSICTRICKKGWERGSSNCHGDGNGKELLGPWEAGRKKKRTGPNGTIGGRQGGLQRSVAEKGTSLQKEEPIINHEEVVTGYKKKEIKGGGEEIGEKIMEQKKGNLPVGG